jgi:hypothetical protein
VAVKVLLPALEPPSKRVGISYEKNAIRVSIVIRRHFALGM